MSKKILHSGKSKKQGDIQIIRAQENFGAGAFFDTPNSEIPENGIRQAVNTHQYDTYAEGRSGSIEYDGQAALPHITGRDGYSWTKALNIITAPVNTFLETDVNSYCVHDDGTADQITRYISATQVEVYSSDAKAASTDGMIQGAINAQEQHPTEKYIILHIDTRVFISDYSLGTWTQVINVSRDSISNSRSRIDFMDEYAIVINSGGIFKVRFDIPMMWELNSNIPTNKLLDIGDDSGSNYGYNGIYTMTRLRGATVGKDRKDSGVLIEQETGSVKLEKDETVFPPIYRDTSSVWNDNPVSSTNPYLWEEFSIPYSLKKIASREKQYTHYSFYRSLDIGFNGTDNTEGVGNNPEILVFVKDVPVAKAFTAYKVDSIVTATNGQFEIGDVGSVIEFQNGNRYVIEEYIDELNVRIDPDYYYGSSTETPQSAGIGNGEILTLSQTGTTVTQVSGQLTLSDSDVGSMVFWCDGSYSVISDVTAGVITVLDSATRVSQGAVIYPTYRSFNDTTDDDSLEDVLNSGYFQLQNRLFRPMPDANIGCVSPGFLITMVMGSGHFYYSQLPAAGKYVAGMYLPGQQEDESIEDNVIEVVAMSDRICFFGRNSSWGVASNVDNTFAPYPGVIVSKLNQASIIDKGIGCLDDGTIQQMENNCLIMLTNENGVPGCRIFNGIEWSEDLSISSDGSRKLVKDVLAGCFTKYSSAYVDGEYIIWGIS